MYKLTTDRSGEKVLINLKTIECLIQIDSDNTLAILTSGKKIYFKGDIETNMAILGLKSGE